MLFIIISLKSDMIDEYKARRGVLKSLAIESPFIMRGLSLPRMANGLLEFNIELTGPSWYRELTSLSQYSKQILKISRSSTSDIFKR